MKAIRRRWPPGSGRSGSADSTAVARALVFVAEPLRAGAPISVGATLALDHLGPSPTASGATEPVDLDRLVGLDHLEQFATSSRCLVILVRSSCRRRPRRRAARRRVQLDIAEHLRCARGPDPCGGRTSSARSIAGTPADLRAARRGVSSPMSPRSGSRRRGLDQPDSSNSRYARYPDQRARIGS